MSRMTIALAGALLLSATAVQGQDQWYFGLGAGRANYSGDLDDSSGFKAFGGYRFNDWVGAQAGYVNLGEFDAEEGPGSVEIDGYEASVVGRVPVNPDFYLLGKAGLYVWDLSVNNLPGVKEEDGTEGLVGIGGEFLLPSRIGLRVEWEKYANVGEEDIDLLSAGFSFGF